MNKTIMSIILIMMLIIPIFSISAIEENAAFHQIDCDIPSFGNLGVPSSKWLIGADQIQIDDSFGGFLHEPGVEWAQAFIPTKDTLTAVALYFIRAGHPHDETTISISIREELDAPDLTNITILAGDYKIKDFPPYTWILFDFPDISVTPGHTYYIHETQSHGEWYFDNFYGLMVSINNPYTKGDTWHKDGCTDWVLCDIFFNNPEFSGYDFCFITYHEEPKAKSPSHPFLIFLGQRPHFFPLLKNILLEIFV